MEWSGWGLKQLVVIIVGRAEEDSVSVCWGGQKCKADEQKNAQIGSKWASNDCNVIWVSQ